MNIIRYTDDLKCVFCEKQLKNKNSYAQHYLRCKQNPNRMVSSIEIYNNSEHSAWNKGLTKETDERVLKSAETLSKNTRIERFDEDINDDGKLYSKYLNKCNNAKKEGLKCLLTYEEFCDTVRFSKLKSSDIGFSCKGYVLARYNDEGDYEYGKCRFITQKENSEEKLHRMFPNKFMDS